MFYRLLPGPSSRPPDTVIGESIPESRLAPKPYRRGDPVHEVRTEERAEDPKAPGFMDGLKAGLAAGPASQKILNH